MRYRVVVLFCVDGRAGAEKACHIVHSYRPWTLAGKFDLTSSIRLRVRVVHYFPRTPARGRKASNRPRRRCRRHVSDTSQHVLLAAVVLTADS